MVLDKIVTVSRDGQVQQLARQIGRETFVADDTTEALDIIETVNPDLVLFDHQFTVNHICEFFNLDLRQNKNPIDIPVVVLGNSRDKTDLSADFIRAGVYDYLRDSRDYTRLRQIAIRIKNQSKTANSETSSLKEFFVEDYAASFSIVGRSKAILNKLKMIKLVAASRCNPVLIVGETGTGKELAARAIHVLRHPNEAFVAVNCAALTANLLESELFGHVKGSFTGADREKTGLLEVAKAGTIFLDEISETPLDLQAKLLRVLQEKTFRKVGGTKEIRCRATIITSSNRNLKNETETNRFRRDLYYRLNICPITIAPLRAPERKEDIRLLAEYFLRTSTICPEKRNKITSLTKLAIETLEKHDWPGNVRELCNTIDRAIMLETTDKIGLSSIVIDPAKCGQLSDNPTIGSIQDYSLAKAERQLIARALQETGWQKTRAACLLGITRATLYAKLKQYNIEKGPCIIRNNTEELQNEITVPSFSF